MNLYIKTSLQLLIISTLLSSCAVQNNLYYHNANPYEKGEGNSYVALSTGLQAKVDSVNSDGAIHYSDKLKSNVNLNIGVDYGIARNLTLRGAIHLPMVIGGFGLRGGAQYSILPEDSDFNIALGADFGFVTSRDSFTIFGDVTFEGEAKTKGIINADFFMPITYNLNRDMSLTFSARYSFNSFRIRYKESQEKSFGYNPKATILGLGYKYKELYLEANTLIFEDARIIPTFGIGVTFKI